MSPTYGKLKPMDYAQASMTFALKDGSISGVQSPETTELISAERFSEFINHLYDAASLPEAWVPCLEVIRTHMRSNFAVLIIRQTEGDNIGLTITASGGLEGLLTHDVYSEHSPFLGMPKEQFKTIPDLMSESEWRSSVYYKDWCRVHNIFHVMAADIVTTDGSVYGLRITRPESEPAFSQRDLDLGRMIMPHIRRALNMHLALHHDRQVMSLYSTVTARLMVGVVILDQNGQVLESNPAAKGILDAQDGLRISGGMLEAEYASDNRKLQRLVKDALLSSLASASVMTEGISIARPSGQLNWGLVVQSISSGDNAEAKSRPCVAVFMRNTDDKVDPSAHLAQQLFQLTSAETALVIQLTHGLTLEEAAKALGIRLNTARAHLRSIFSKTGARRQSELVRFFLNSAAWLGSKSGS